MAQNNKVKLVEVTSPVSWGTQDELRQDLISGFRFKYVSIFSTMVLFFILRNYLPFPYPHFLILCGILIICNIIANIALYSKITASVIVAIMTYWDNISSFFVFIFTGGFLSPFYLTHFIAILGSINSYTYSSSLKKLPFRLTMILLVAYLSASLLQKFGIIPNYVEYSNTMMKNDFFFYTILFMISSITINGYMLLTRIRCNINTNFNHMVNSYQHVVKGITSTSGNNFYTDLLSNAANSLNARHMILGLLGKDRSTLDAIVVVKDNVVSSNLSIPLGNDPFRQVISKGIYYLERNLSGVFTLEGFLADVKAESFYGRSIVNSRGETLGLIAVIRDHESLYDPMAASILDIFSSRAAAEMEKEIYERENHDMAEKMYHSQKMEALGKLSGGIAHDLNNMIGGIQGYIEVMKIKLSKLTDTDGILEYPEKISVLTTQAKNIIAQLLQFARKTDICMIPFSINDLVDSLVDIIRHAFPKNIRYEKICKAQKYTVKGDSSMLQNALLNIAVNARDAIGLSGGIITITTENLYIMENDAILHETGFIKPGEFIKLSISDTGCGMDKALMSRIFEPFFTTKKLGGGTGLGLSSVFGCVEKHGGFIKVESEIGKGSSFIIYLPLQ